MCCRSSSELQHATLVVALICTAQTPLASKGTWEHWGLVTSMIATIAANLHLYVYYVHEHS